MRLSPIVGLVVLLFWQVAPVQVVTNPGGRFRLALAGSVGEWEDYQEAQYDCNGALTTPERSSMVEMRSVGARADYFLGQGGSRLTVVAGNVRADSGWVGHGAFWGAEIALDGGGVGASIGLRHAGDALLPVELRSPDRGVSPTIAFSLRLGRESGKHTVLEYGPLSETPSLTGEIRVGAGFGGGRGRFSTLVGLEAGPQGPSGGRGLAGFGEVSIPVVGDVDLLLRGVYGPGHLMPHWGVGGGLRTHWGR